MYESMKDVMAKWAYSARHGTEWNGIELNEMKAHPFHTL